MRSYLSVASLLLLCGTAASQMPAPAAIPATQPTHSVSDLPSAQPIPATGRAGQGHVSWTGTALAVTGNGDSLRSLLREVARTTGMRVTGGVPDEPVFGSYGPAPVQQVLAALFNGLGVNMLLVNGSPTQPKELILTARTGGATPPQPAQPITLSDDPADVNLAQPHPGRHTSPESFSQPAQLPQQGLQGPAQVPASNTGGADSNGNASTTDANGQSQSPNGVRTPEQIFEELRRRQQQMTNHR